MSDVLQIAVAAVALFLWLRAMAVVAVGLFDAHRRRAHPEPDSPGGPRGAWPHIAALIPAFNEERSIEATLRSIAASDYPFLEIVLIDDGSKDRTAEIAERLTGEIGRLRVVRKHRNQGKASALNTGLLATTAPLIATVDADTRLSPATLRRLAAAMSDPGVSAAAANIKVENRRCLMGAMQSIEYVCALNLDRRAQNCTGSINMIPGAAALFRREPLEAAGGFPGGTVTEDADLTLELVTRGYELRYVPQAVACTRAPSTLMSFMRQRRRWIYGNMQCAWKHRGGSAKLPARARWLSLPDFWISRVVVHLLPIPLAVGATLGSLVDPMIGRRVVVMLAGWLLFEVLRVALAHAIERERLSVLWVAPLQRVLWPLLFSVIVLWILWSRITRAPIGWGRPPHTLPSPGPPSP